MGKALHVLIVEDSQTDTELVLQELRSGGFDPNYKRVDRPLAFKQALEEEAWDLIISDYVMPHFSEPAAMEIFKKSKQDIPFIVISGKIGEETAVEAMKSGATDYVMKDNLGRLVPAINRELHDAKERASRRSAEQELANFIASLTHDLRTPILAEIRILELITSGSFGPISPQLYEVIQELVRSNYFMQHMVNNMLYAYKYKQGKVHLKSEPTDIATFLASYIASISVQSMLEARDLHITVEPTDSIPKVCMDQHEIHRVLNNMLKNAIDHSPKGAAIDVSMQPEKDFVRINIQDHGSGIDPCIEPYLFSPYTHISAKKYHQVGLGLGLYLSKRIVEAHCGKIGYDCSPDEGCVFYFELPVVQE